MASIEFLTSNKTEGRRDTKLPDTVFNAEVKEYLIHEALRSSLPTGVPGPLRSKIVQPSPAAARSRFKQKGTGKARQGAVVRPSIRAVVLRLVRNPKPTTCP